MGDHRKMNVSCGDQSCYIRCFLVYQIFGSCVCILIPSFSWCYATVTVWQSEPAVSTTSWDRTCEYHNCNGSIHYILGSYIWYLLSRFPLNYTQISQKLVSELRQLIRYLILTYYKSVAEAVIYLTIWFTKFDH